MTAESTAEAIRQDRIMSAHMRAHVAAQEMEAEAAGLVATFNQGIRPSAGQVRAVEDAMAKLTSNLATIRELEKAGG